MIYTVHNTVAEGKPLKVYVNGVEVVGAVYADTEKGVVEYHPQPPRVKKPERDRIYSRFLKGNVTVEPL